MFFALMFLVFFSLCVLARGFAPKIISFNRNSRGCLNSHAASLNTLSVPCISHFCPPDIPCFFCKRRLRFHSFCSHEDKHFQIILRVSSKYLKKKEEKEKSRAHYRVDSFPIRKTIVPLNQYQRYYLYLERYIALCAFFLPVPQIYHHPSLFSRRFITEL